MAGHQLIDGYLTELEGRLPGAVVEELADGLIETWQHHRRHGIPTDEAARAAIAEFGTPQQVNDAFVASAPGRRVARALLATGPLVGISWGASLIAAEVWTWPLPRPAAIAYGVILFGTVAALAAAATARHSFTRTRLGTFGAGALLVLDALMLAAVVLTAHLVWPMALAIPASLARAWFSLRRLPAVRQPRRA